MSKSCGRCRRYLSLSESARCRHCDAYFHLRCVALPPAGAVSPSWHCPGCIKSKATKKPSAVVQEPPTNQIGTGETMHSSPNNSTFESTQELASDITDELRTLRNHLRSVNKDLQLFREELADIRTSVQAYHKRVEALEERVDVLEKQRPDHAGGVDDILDQLKQDLRDRDQQLLANDVEIVNFPESRGENPIHVVMQIAVKIGMNIDERDIVSAERVGGRHIVATEAAGPEARPRALAVRLARRDVRDTLLRSARDRRGVTSADLVPGAPRRFYINERLTKANRQLFRLSRDAGQRAGWQYVWVKRGRILARNKPGDRAYTIKSEADIGQVFNCSAP